jgi:hypothetical protein
MAFFNISFGSDQINTEINLVSEISDNGVLSDIISRQISHPVGGGNPHIFAELVGAAQIPMSFYEPDPSTFRYEYYYNTRQNRLYKKINVDPKPVWKIIR